MIVKQDIEVNILSINDTYLKNVWNKTLNAVSLSQKIDDNIFATFYRDSNLFSLNANKATITVPRLFNKIIMDRDLIILKSCLEAEIEQEVDIEIFLESDLITKSTDAPITAKFLKNNLNESYVFSNFIVGKSNVQAHVSSLTCANNPGELYNPLFIYGNSGLGKTHLLNAIGNFININFPNKKIGLITGLDFVNCVFTASKTNELDKFKNELFDLDLLLIDDIQFIAGKEKTHEIFFSVFNELVNNNKQVCITCDRLPSEIKGLEDRIISRFNSGLNVNIEAPEYETAFNIVKSKIEQRTDLMNYIDDEAISFISMNFSQDVRSLEGALNRLIFFGINFTESNTIDLKIATEAFKGQIKEKPNETTTNSIIKIVCDYYGLTKQQLISKTRTKNIANARHIAMYLARKLLDTPFVKIGEDFGKRDHSTVINACDRVEKQIKENPLFKKALAEIENSIKN